MNEATTQQRQFCRKGIHTCIPAVTLAFDGGGRLHWCAEHAADAELYRDQSDQLIYDLPEWPPFVNERS